jgi:acetolactate synthase, large subunit, biosynthetic type
MRGAEILLKALEAESVDTVFGYPGGAIMPVYDALHSSNLKHILVRHEQSAALAADAYARATGRVGVCLSTSGPGATNLVTGIANAYMDSVPIVCITGQVPSPLMGTDAFQEVDIFGISMPVVKHSYIVRTTESLAEVVREAFTIARSGRPGPVLIDIPKDVMLNDIPTPDFVGSEEELLQRAEARQLSIARDMIAASQRPLVYAGGGVRMARATEELRAFVDATGIPVVTTLHGIGSVSGYHPLNLGMLGMHGTKAANLCVQDCDLLIAVGARFDDRVTGKLAEFAPHARVVHLDGDPCEVSKLRSADCPVVGDIKVSLNFLHVKPIATSFSDWVGVCLDRKVEHAFRYDPPGDFIYAPALIKQLSDRQINNDEEMFVTCDVGQHQMWVAQHFKFGAPQKHLTSGGLGTMGYGLPAAIGVQLAHPNARVVCMSGDGSFMMNVQELATINRYKLPVKIVLFDNQALGMVRQWQELFFEKRYSEVDLSDNPDFVKVAEAFGIPAIRVESRSAVHAAVERISNDDGPLLAHVIIDPAENVWPLVPPGKNNSQMLEARNSA